MREHPRPHTKKRFCDATEFKSPLCLSRGGQDVLGQRSVVDQAAPAPDALRQEAHLRARTQPSQPPR